MRLAIIGLALVCLVGTSILSFSGCEKMSEEADSLISKVKSNPISPPTRPKTLGPHSVTPKRPRGLCPDELKEVKVDLFGKKEKWCAAKAPGGQTLLTKYYGPGKLKRELTIDNRRMKQRSFSQKGSLTEEGSYRDQKKEGVWTEFHPNGAVKSRITWHKNKKHGPAEQYDSKGMKIAHYSYYADQPHGPYFAYHPNGSIKEQGRYEHGQKNGKWKIYDASGRPQSVGTLRHGKPVTNALTGQVQFSGGDKLGSRPPLKGRYQTQPRAQAKPSWKPVEKNTGWKPL